MFTNPTPLNPQHHRSLRLVQAPNYRFADQLQTTPVVSSEAKHVAREYVLVFPKTAHDVPQALLGTARNTNAYIGRQRHDPPWLGRYVPAHLRRYPFVAGAPAHAKDDDNGKARAYVLMFDQGAPQLSWTVGQRLFTDDGEPTQVLQRIEKALKTLQVDFTRTQNLVHQVDAAGLLKEENLYVRPSNGEPRGLTGFRVIDQEKLNALSGDDLKTLHDSGALMLVHAHLVSLTNLKDGLLAKRPPAMPGAQAQKEPQAQTQADSPIQSDDTFDFSL